MGDYADALRVERQMAVEQGKTARVAAIDAQLAASISPPAPETAALAEPEAKVMPKATKRAR